ncbi:J domain-containing protein [Qipengyuania sp. XHP0207]|uniref:J domain-containing protein n=1 Tax=Qipengyuania sp. XHP0207 TaxID=3038078 RepID=UPI00241E0DD5|nr:J domain-containing protein [Qipengyuania sp. XHP0207]MDG5748188.1 J domain-containing protein [Qipengyuania sp. XHP0207]
MLRLIALALLLSVLCRWLLGRWPWEYLRGPDSRSQALFRARKLLGVGARADAREIRDAHRRMTAMIHPDRGGNNAQMQDLNAARDLLLNDLPYEPPEHPNEP